MLSKIIYEKKYNSYKNSNNINKNYKMSKYLNKLNGGAESKNINPKDFKEKLGEGSFGKVYNIDLNDENYAAKEFKERESYNNEKNLYIKKLSIFCGILDPGSNIYYSPQENIILTSLNYRSINHPITKSIVFIQGDILNNIKTLIHDDLKGITDIFIYTNLSSVHGIFLDRSEKIIGSVIECDGRYNIYIDSFKTMRLIYFNDENKTLVYKNLGISLFNATHNPNPTEIPSEKQRVSVK